MGIKTCGDGLKTVLVNNVTSLANNGGVFAPSETPAKVPGAFPAAFILLGDVNYDITLDRDVGANVTWRVLVFMSKADYATSLGTLIPLVELTGSSVPGAIGTDPTLDGNCDSAWVQANLGVGNTEWGDTNYITTEFRVMALV